MAEVAIAKEQKGSSTSYRMDTVALNIIAANVDGVSNRDFKPWEIISDPNPKNNEGIVMVILRDDKGRERARCNVPKKHLAKIRSDR
ncbi:MAG: hypothetical protein A3H01_02250 [Candidatus Wildermuthbacteria bacterium RIFCSPLOWO2_12_FULL_40_9]|uniref:Uncharacterized protein n=2 Tax=Candidatus Wildermuthiibacteriota TaxID=1817923 RepID=A0A1G2RE43_9BACT|nr:MAG: hypothetical protein A3F15_01220 [Candidatus Wildermuthbacteria bacterium RIFCSPHIGHO2_12_FULL_40_12]OHA76916.1 MAG: hypothetical protein A3H01_02250 [Candidatus Wildermuthbacteria bacterium RIFCSPLOWO2_12_FULL_40_9]